MPVKAIYKHPHLAIGLEMVKLCYLLTKLNKVSVVYSQISNTVSFSLQDRVMPVLHKGNNLIFVGYVAWGTQNPVETNLLAFDRILSAGTQNRPGRGR
jgi:hypothetical protein